MTQSEVSFRFDIWTYAHGGSSSVFIGTVDKLQLKLIKCAIPPRFVVFL